MVSLFDPLSQLEKRGDSAALCTIIRERGSVPRHTGSKMLVYADGRFEGTIGGGEMESRVIHDALEAMRTGAAKILAYALVDPQGGDPGVCGGEVEIFVEPIKPTPTLLVIGGGHVGKALAHLGKWLGFRVALSDDRAEFCRPEWAPDADQYLPIAMADLPRQFAFNTETYIVLSTRGVPLDVDGLPGLLDAPHAYLGVIGSRRRWATTAKQLEERGVSKEKLARVHAPMGLELNAETPEEIAVSILSEIIMLRRGGSGESMKGSGESE